MRLNHSPIQGSFIASPDIRSQVAKFSTSSSVTTVKKASGGIGQNPEAWGLLAPRFIPYPPVELLEEGDQFIAAAVLGPKHGTLD
jgi:hypothetical protein